MSPIVQIQQILTTTPDGIWGPRSQAALDDLAKRARGGDAMARTLICHIQATLLVAVDGDFGPASQAALDAQAHKVPVQGWPFEVHHDGNDLVCCGTITCFGGGFDPQDNGDTASGISTLGPVRGVSLAMDGLKWPRPLSTAEHAALDGAPWPVMPWHTPVTVTIGGDTFTPEAGLLDLGPGHQASRPGDPHVCDPVSYTHLTLPTNREV